MLIMRSRNDRPGWSGTLQYFITRMRWTGLPREEANRTIGHPKGSLLAHLMRHCLHPAARTLAASPYESSNGQLRSSSVEHFLIKTNYRYG